MLKCIQCEQFKENESFYKNRSKRGRSIRCKNCISKNNADPEKAQKRKEYQKRYRETNPDKIKSLRFTHLEARKQKNYIRKLAGITELLNQSDWVDMTKTVQSVIEEILLTACCMDCGYDNPISLDFDHVRDMKLYNISQIRHYPWCKLFEDELKKCDIVCKNCHAIRTADRDLNWRVKLWEKKQFLCGY